MNYKYKSISYKEFRASKYAKILPKEYLDELDKLTLIFPFKLNEYVAKELIDWDNWTKDPIFNLLFPNKQMLKSEQYELLSRTYDKGTLSELKEIILKIWKDLNPHAEGQMDLNVPKLNGKTLFGLQHQYQETVLAFPAKGQTCHAYCSFCFRWPQFIGHKEFKISLDDTSLLTNYLASKPLVTDVLLTGGDPMVIGFEAFKKYLDPLLENINKTNIQTIRIGTKSLSYHPFKFTTDPESDQFLSYFESIVSKRINLSIIAHFNHPRELSPAPVAEAIKRLRSVGAQIRSQSPVLKHINDKPETWAEMWRKQVNMNIIPYYMFIARDTGARQYFELPLETAWIIFRDAYKQVSGVCKTVRGPIMSSLPGKVQILGKTQAEKEGKMVDAFVLRFIQARNPEWVNRPFLAKYDPNAYWINDLKPLYGEKFFYEDELETLLSAKEKHSSHELIEELNTTL